MKTIRTIVCKLDPTSEQIVMIDSTLTAFAEACNYVADICRDIDSHTQFDVHKVCYQNVRFTFGLSANLAIRAIARVCTALKVPEKADSTFAPTSIDYDVRIFSFHESDWTFGLTLLGGRQRFATSLGDFQRDTLRGAHPTSATLVERDGCYYLHVQVKEDAPEPAIVTAFLGVDLGIVNIVTDSTGETFSGERVDRNRRRRATARKQHQRKGTKSAKRKLKRMAKRQQRFQAAVNHVISKRLVEKAKTLGTGIAMEDLEGIRDRCERTATKSFRRRLGNWGFFQLRTFVEYKAERAGVPVVFVSPRNTSRTCSRCGHCEKANRPNQATFRCKQCGHSMNADENAALNISALGPLCKPARRVSVSASSIND